MPFLPDLVICAVSFAVGAAIGYLFVGPSVRSLFRLPPHR